MMNQLDKVESAKLLEMNMGLIVVPELKAAMESTINKLYCEAAEEWKANCHESSLQEYLRFTKEEYERFCSRIEGGIDIAV